MGPSRGPRNPTFTQVFCTNHAHKLPEIIFTPSLPNHAGCQNDHSRNSAIFFIQFTFSRFKTCRITPLRFLLGGPLQMSIEIL